MFLVCGEALMDVFAVGDTATGMTLDARVGGSPFNVAVGLARLAQPVAFFGAVSTGFLGERLVRALQSEGVSLAHVARSDAPTTLGLVGLDEKGVPSYAFYGDGAADRQLQPEALPTTAFQALHFGSYTTVAEPTATTLRTLVQREHGKTLISYDPNVRLNVEPDVARWRAHLQWMLPRTDLLKISDEDLGLLMPGRTIESFAAEALAQGVKLAVVTRGSAGAQAWTAQATAGVPTPKVAVVDTVGAGDTFQAALLTWLAEHGSVSSAALAGLSAARLSDALAFAVRAAAITCSRRGADMPRRAELAP
ncbi:MAG: fructokinase [Methylibium sp. NZG]|nr:MAG: fructokinase [Methylibium sp. NZG]